MLTSSNYLLLCNIKVLGQLAVPRLKLGYSFLYKKNKSRKCINTASTLPVYKDHLYTRTTCIQGPPMYMDHLCTRTTYVHGPPVYKDHLHIRIYKDHLYIYKDHPFIKFCMVRPIHATSIIPMPGGGGGNFTHEEYVGPGKSKT